MKHSQQSDDSSPFSARQDFSLKRAIYWIEIEKAD